MSVDTQRIRLTEQTLDRVRIELALLRMERAAGSHRGHTDREHRELRIRHLHELISNTAAGHEPPDDGVAEPGMVLTVRYEAADVSETFLLADRDESTHNDDLTVYSPHSPLGMALAGAAQGERREFRIPGGETMGVTLVKAVPYRSGCLRPPHSTTPDSARGGSRQPVTVLSSTLPPRLLPARTGRAVPQTTEDPTTR